MSRHDGIPRSAAPALTAIVLCMFLAITTEVLPVGLLPQMSRGLGVTEPVTGLLVTVYAGLVAVLAVPLTGLTARVPRKPLLLATVAAYGVGDLVIALAPDFAVACVGRGIAGAAHAVFFSVSYAYAIGLVPPAAQGRAVATTLAGASLGFVAGVPLATTLGAAVGWRAAFAVLAAGALVLLAAAARLLPPLTTTVLAATRSTAADWWRGGLIAVAAANVLGFTAHYLLYTFVSPLLIADGVPLPVVGAALFLAGAAGLAGLWAAGLVVDRRPRAGIQVALVVCAVGLGLLVVTGRSPVSVLLIGPWVLAFGAMPTFFAIATIRTGVLSADLSAAVNNSMSNAGIAAGAAVGGLIDARAGVAALVPVTALLFLLALGIVTAARRGFPTRP